MFIRATLDTGTWLKMTPDITRGLPDDRHKCGNATTSARGTQSIALQIGMLPHGYIEGVKCRYIDMARRNLARGVLIPRAVGMFDGSNKHKNRGQRRLAPPELGERLLSILRRCAFLKPNG